MTKLLYFLMAQETKIENESQKAQLERTFKERVFAADLPHGLRAYKAMFPEDFKPKEKHGDQEFEVEEFTPQNAEDLEMMMAEVRALGLAEQD